LSVDSVVVDATVVDVVVVRRDVDGVTTASVVVVASVEAVVGGNVVVGAAVDVVAQSVGVTVLDGHGPTGAASPELVGIATKRAAPTTAASRPATRRLPLS
jgi:hypothetical protein